VLDPALLRPGRFDTVLEVPPPDREGRRTIFEIGLRGKPLADDVNVDDLAAGSEGLSGADIHGVCKEAALEAVRECVSDPSSQGKKPATAGLLIEQRHLRKALQAVAERNASRE